MHLLRPCVRYTTQSSSTICSRQGWARVCDPHLSIWALAPHRAPNPGGRAQQFALVLHIWLQRKAGGRAINSKPCWRGVHMRPSGAAVLAARSKGDSRIGNTKQVPGRG